MVTVAMSLEPVIAFLRGLLLLSLLLDATPSHAQSIEELKKGVVKITAKADGMTKVGTGFIVRLEKDAAYIVTASHVIQGDSQPKVVFRGNEVKSFPAQVKGLKGSDPRGVAVLVVLGDVPRNLTALPVNAEFESSGGEEVTVIGFPRLPAVPWAVTPGMVTGQEGRISRLLRRCCGRQFRRSGPVEWESDRSGDGSVVPVWLCSANSDSAACPPRLGRPTRGRAERGEAIA